MAKTIKYKYNPIVSFEKEEFFEILLKLVKNADTEDSIDKIIIDLLISYGLDKEFYRYSEFHGYFKKKEDK